MNAPIRQMPRFASVEKAIEGLKPELPLYLLHPARFRAAAKRFLDAFPGDTLYAVKANSHPLVLRQIWDAGIRHFDTASLGEIELVKNRFPDAICVWSVLIRSWALLMLLRNFVANIFSVIRIATPSG